MQILTISRLNSFTRILCIVFCWSPLISACHQTAIDNGKKILLTANRKAPLGWVYLTLYNDSSFEFTSQGLRSEMVFPGTYRLKKDTLFFRYKDSVPKAGTIAVIGSKTILYIAGSYSESVEIKSNQFIK